VRGSILISDNVEADYGEALDRVAPGVPRLVARAGGPSPDPSRVEVVYFSGDLYPERIRELAIAALKAEGLAWLHSFSAGVDDNFFQILLDRGVRLTTSSGAHAVPIAHTAMLYLLAFSRDLRGWQRDQDARRWNPRNIRDLQGRMLGVVGLGPIGREVARLGRSFRMQVVGLRRRPRGDEPCETWTLDRLGELLTKVDYLVLALPLTDQTRHLIDAAALARMKPDALLVNVARGEIVDEAALVEALREGRIGGAALDVFEREPLPETSPLWTLPNAIVTPHSSGTNPGNLVRATELFLDNLGRYLQGEVLRNQVEAP
jgi:phosphoglycerate dehydrogenase-like enzyme